MTTDLEAIITRIARLEERTDLRDDTYWKGYHAGYKAALLAAPKEKQKLEASQTPN